MSRDFTLTHQSAESAVLLFHGFTGTPGEMYHYGKFLHDQGYDVYCPVLPGHCSGLEAIRRITWMDWYRFALEQYDGLASRYRNVFVSGICLGAVMSLLVGIERKGIAAVAALSTTLYLDGWAIPPIGILLPLAWITVYKFIYSFPESGPLGVRDKEVRKKIKASLEDKNSDSLNCFPLIGVYELEKLKRYVVKNLPKINAPLIVFHSRRDDLAGIRNGNVVYEKSGSAIKEYIILENSYHLITLDREKELVSERTHEFFRRFSGS